MSLFLSLHREKITPPRTAVASEEMNCRWRMVRKAGNKIHNCQRSLLRFVGGHDLTFSSRQNKQWGS